MKLTDEQRQRITKAMDSVDIGKCDYLTMLAAGMRELSNIYMQEISDHEKIPYDLAMKCSAMIKAADDLEAK